MSSLGFYDDWWSGATGGAGGNSGWPDAAGGAGNWDPFADVVAGTGQAIINTSQGGPLQSSGNGSWNEAQGGAGSWNAGENNLKPWGGGVNTPAAAAPNIAAGLAATQDLFFRQAAQWMATGSEAALSAAIDTASKLANSSSEFADDARKFIRDNGGWFANLALGFGMSISTATIVVGGAGALFAVLLLKK